MSYGLVKISKKLEKKLLKNIQESKPGYDHFGNKIKVGDKVVIVKN